MFPYQNLKVYQLSEEYYRVIHRFLKNAPQLSRYVKDQLGRASLSIPANIAEGSAKFSKRDQRNFYVVARGSAFECSAILRIMFSENELDKELCDHCLALLDQISRMLYVLVRGLE